MKKFVPIILGLFVISSLYFAPVSAQMRYQPLKNCADGNCAPVLTPPEIIFVPHIVVQKNYQPIVLRDLDIKTNVIGNVATTTYEMVMYNPNSTTLEAEFVFPLSENQTVAAVALDINGKMREGVVVEKQKARATFEAVVRQGQDPLLVEKTAGQQFKTRIYPFMPNGTRKIRITLEEPLQKENGKFKYMLPLTYKQKLDSFTLNIEIPTNATDLPEVTTDIADFRFTQTNQVIRSHFEASDYELNNHLSFNIPQTDENQIFTHSENGKTYFYGNLDIAADAKTKTLPQTVAVIWDTSLSGSKRNIAKEKELLNAYIKTLNNVKIIFVPFNLQAGNIAEIDIQNGDSSAFDTFIDNIVYDGATRFDALHLKDIKADEFLLFSDGLNTFGNNSDLELPQAPLYTINSADEYSLGKLKKWATQTLAVFINLAQIDTPTALSALTSKPLRIVGYNGNDITDIYPQIGSVIAENISFAGILSAPQSELEIALGYDADHIIKTEKIIINSGGDNPAVARLWAMQKIAFLEQDAEKNKAEILTLGQEYSVVTENTSLLVLESAADYLRYNITPPLELQSEYNNLQNNQRKTEAESKYNALQDALNQAKKVKEWWQKGFDVKAQMRKKYQQLHANNARRHNNSLAADEEVMVMADEADMNDSLNGMAVARESANFGVAPESARAFGVAAAPQADMAKSAGVASRPTATNSIKIQQWDPDVPYLRILKASKDNELYNDYLKLKIGYQDQPSFYFDITDEFIRRGQNDEAMLVLSNIMEMQLDNVELLRIAANKLMQIKDYPHAIELFEKIAQLRGEHPQSFRDLALAYQANGQYQKAFDTFKEILEKDWNRFNAIKQIIFVEMNNLLSLHPEVNTEDLDKEFIFAMPVDIRVVLSWSTDSTDIDLHVTDPLQEECFYGHKNTLIGGRYPHDFTQGFGPEEFMLKKAVNGKYVIHTNNFGDHRQSISGPTTIYLDLYTNYARQNQKHERVLVRTENVKENNSIGEIVWENGEDLPKVEEIQSGDEDEVDNIIDIEPEAPDSLRQRIIHLFDR